MLLTEHLRPLLLLVYLISIELHPCTSNHSKENYSKFDILSFDSLPWPTSNKQFVRPMKPNRNSSCYLNHPFASELAKRDLCVCQCALYFDTSVVYFHQQYCKQRLNHHKNLKQNFIVNINSFHSFFWTRLNINKTYYDEIRWIWLH